MLSLETSRCSSVAVSIASSVDEASFVVATEDRILRRDVQAPHAVDQWKCTRQQPSFGWHEASFDDSDWSKVRMYVCVCVCACWA